MFKFFRIHFKLVAGVTKPLENKRFLSYFHATCNDHLVYKTVGKLLDETAERFGNKTAYVSVYQDQRLTFEEVKQKADDFAAGILELGISKGDRVGLWSPNSMEWYVTSFALAKAGVISVYLNPSYLAREMKHCLNAVGVKMLIAAESFRDQNYLKILEEIEPEITKSKPGTLKSKNLPSLETVVFISDSKIPGTIPYNTIAKSGTETSRKILREITEEMDPDDAYNIQFTSGTTGSPKGAVLSHHNVVNNSLFMSSRQQFHQNDHVMLLMGPLFHAMGSVIGVLNCLHSGATLIGPERAFSPSKAVEAILKERCTILLGTPTMYVDVINIVTEKNLKVETPELAICGGAYASSSLFNDMIEKLGVKRVSSVYGLTETGPVTFMSKPTDNKEDVLTTVGYIMDHTEAKVVDDKGKVVPWDTPGELWVRGYCNMKGYWNEEKKTKETLTPEHWLRTGDQFTLSKNGYGKIVGRIKDMIIRGGENIFPAEVEEFLSTHPEILEVQVVGLPDKRLGEQVCACIRLQQGSKLSETDVKEFCKGKIAAFKIPHYVYLVDSYPKTSSGKIQKFMLRIQATKHFNLEE